VPGFTQLTLLLASRMDPGERELSDQDLRLVFGLVDVTPEVRAEIADALRAAGVEVLGLEPLVLRKAAPPPVEPPPPPPRSRTPFYVGGGVVAAVALLFALAPRSGGSSAPSAVAPVPTLKLHARGTVTAPAHTRDHGRARDRGKGIHGVSIARPRTPDAELPCDTQDGACEPRPTAHTTR
jgi:hypothetical protein